MMKIVITAGGTSEKIDDVRTITNSSTGRLGYAVERLFYSSTQMSWKQSTTSMERGLDIRSTRR